VHQGGVEALNSQSGPDRPELVQAPVALVAGASRGLGLLIARELGRQGPRLMICARSGDELTTAAELLRADGFEVATEVCDVADEQGVAALVERTEQELGPVEVLVCVAGINQVGPLASLNRSHITAAVDTMLWGPVNTALAVVPGMRARGHGRIGIITSVGGLISAPHLLPYSTAKFGAVGFSRGLHSELAGTGVTVTTVAPGLMRTGSHLRAYFVGDQAREYAWFAAAATLPLLSMDAERAAERIVRGILVGRPVVITTPLAQLAPRVDALFPTLTSALLALTTRLLPKAPVSRAGETIEGRQAQQELRTRSRLVLDRLTVLGRRAADRFNEGAK
jgi:NAD(P)-dependent dehydrogenase (short-subunit alcohol dehydrogenase family)